LSETPSHETNAPAAPTGDPALERRLGPVSLTIYGIGNMLGAGIYGTIGAAANELGNALWLAFVASMVAAGLTGLSYASLGSRYPRAAGAAYITRRAFKGSYLPYLVGLAVMCSGLTSMATSSHVFADYTQDLLGWGKSPWTARGIVLAFLLVVAAINLRGIRESAWVNAVCTCIEVGGLLFIIAVGVRFIGSVNYLDAHAPQNVNGDLTAALILSGAVLTFFSFIGFEDLLNVSEEVKDPQRTLPLALVAALGIATVIYITVSVVAVSVVPAGQLAGGDKKQVLVQVINVAAPWLPAGSFALIAMFAVSNTALLNYIMGSRLAYGMAKQGLLPKALGKVHPTRRTPHVAIFVLLGIVLVLVMLGDIGSLARATSLLLLFSFTTVNIALVVLKRRPGEARGRFEIPVFVPILAACVCLTMIGASTWNWIGDAIEAQKAGKSVMTPLMPLFLAAGLLVLITVLFLTLRPRAAEEA
jgi:amino acid transporter